MVEKRTKSIAVFCASASGARPEYLASARSLGRAIAACSLGLVYGGASVGLMGALADAALAAGGEVVGVIPDVILDREIAHRGLTELRIVRTMHERKALMADLADAFIALPGGYGTMDEFMEIVTWAQLRIHSKPCVLVNTCGYYDALLRFLDKAVDEGLVRAENRTLIQVARDTDEALAIVEREQRGNATPHDARLDELVK